MPWALSIPGVPVAAWRPVWCRAESWEQEVRAGKKRLGSFWCLQDEVYSRAMVKNLPGTCSAVTVEYQRWPKEREPFELMALGAKHTAPASRGLLVKPSQWEGKWALWGDRKEDWTRVTSLHPQKSLHVQPHGPRSSHVTLVSLRTSQLKPQQPRKPRSWGWMGYAASTPQTVSSSAGCLAPAHRL